ncbi:MULTISPECIES: hypothetical protein [Streptomyces]|uniref:DDE Tnp4 domain-containing protein n=1 Tax=Streptomyces galilaeus TaxID=33899 RepID=A0ABW9IVR3_STRGJ
MPVTAGDTSGRLLSEAPPPRHQPERPLSHRLTEAEKEANRLVNRERAANEHSFANLKTWRVLTKVRMNTRHATILLRALLVLANSEVQR